MTKKKQMTAYAKIVKSHLGARLNDGTLILGADWRWCHEITTPPAIISAENAGRNSVFDPAGVVAMIDHVSPSKDSASATQARITREWAKMQGIKFYDVGRNGVCHALIPEKGHVTIGGTGIMGDSHTCTHGAFCMLSVGVGTTDLEASLLTKCFVIKPQKVIRINLVGDLPKNVYPKDFTLSYIKKIGVKGATGTVLEFGGPAIDKMSMAGRMTISNMAVEAGASTGMMMVDKTTIDYLWPCLQDKYSCKDAALADLSRHNSDENCKYDEIVNIHVDKITPVITQNYSPGDVVAVQSLETKQVDQVYIGSCTNGRAEDFRIAAQVFEKYGCVCSDIRAVCVPATQSIWNELMRDGTFQILSDAGCHISGPSCGACLGMSCGVIAECEVCVSTTNRNFRGRMGDGGMVHLASPATAAMTAINGYISTPEIGFSAESMISSPDFDYEYREPGVDIGSIKEFLDEFKTDSEDTDGVDFSGDILILNHENGKLMKDVDTDQIIPAKYLTEIEMSVFGEHCLEDAPLSDNQRKNLARDSVKIIVGGENFGCGSSREHAPWAFREAGVRCVIAPSFARIFEGNMFNNGMLAIVLPEDEIGTVLHAEIDMEDQQIVLDTSAGGTLFLSFNITNWQKQLIEKGGLVNLLIETVLNAN